MTFYPLSALMTSDRPDTALVAIVRGEPKDFGEFRRDVIATVHKIKARRALKVVLATNDSYAYCVGLLAALHSGCRVTVPPNAQAGTLGDYVSRENPLLTDQGPEKIRNQIEIGGRIDVDFDFAVLTPERAFLDFYTSGSTGTPKRIPKRLSQIENEITVLQQTWAETLQGAPALGTVSHQHIFGLYFKALWPLSAGRAFYAETFEIWEELLAVAPPASCFVSSPAHLSRIPPFDPLTPGTGPCMIFSAGGPLSNAAALDAARLFGPLPMEIFGSTETGGVAHRQQQTPATPFTPLAGMETRSDEAGLLSVKSNYTDDEDWAETNDIAQWFEDGRFLLTGRSDQFVKIEGKRVSLVQVEKYLGQSELVQEAAVIVLEDDRGSLAAVVELTPPGWQEHEIQGAFRLNRHLREILHDHLEHAAMPRRWRFVTKLPVNAQGKRDRTALHDLFD
ncbi:MAG: hypothetical protein COB93_08045 [Sneathiella sp.]|nr:MAG: hypothetical protein COB93_08045 [Sneathiella sp.]